MRMSPVLSLSLCFFHKCEHSYANYAYANACAYFTSVSQAYASSIYNNINIVDLVRQQIKEEALILK